MIIDFKAPKGWHELTQSQLKRVFELLAGDYTAEAVKTMLLMEWNDAKVISRVKGDIWLLRHKKKMFEVPVWQIADVITALDWVTELPKLPVCIEKIGWHRAVDPAMQGVPFQTYIMVDNLYQGYIKTRDSELLHDMAEMLYGHRVKLAPWQEVAVFYWVASLKNYFTLRFPDFFKPVSTEGGNLLGTPETSVEQAMNAQIRALTKGDVTKENEVLQLDTWRALTELNAQAREYQEMTEKYGNKK